MKAYTLIGINGNAYSIMGYVRDAMDDAKMTKDDIDAYVESIRRQMKQYLQGSDGIQIN